MVILAVNWYKTQVGLKERYLMKTRKQTQKRDCCTLLGIYCNTFSRRKF